MSSEIVAEMADDEGTLTALLTTFRSSCPILEASTCRNDLPARLGGGEAFPTRTDRSGLWQLPLRIDIGRS